MPARFSIQQILSDHGSGQLARALDLHSGMTVVVRIFKCASEDERHSLEALMGVLAELRHAHIETIGELVREGQDLIVVTEESEGETVSEIVATGPLSADEFKVVAVQLLGALSAAHQRGAVHGSIHAGRMRITRRAGSPWKARITGYGLGFSDAGKTDDIAPFLCVPPEQWEQLPARRRSDVYSLGCVFYQALSARSPFDGKTLKEVRHKHIKHDLRPLDQVAPQAPAWLCNWVMTLLVASPDDRPESATAALDSYRTAEASRNTRTQSVILPSVTAAGAGVPATTGFVQVAGSAFFRVPNLNTQTVSIKPIDPLINTARQAARVAQQQAAAPQRPSGPQPGRVKQPTSEPAGENHTKHWIIAGAVTVAIIGLVVFLMQGGQKTAPAPIKVASNPIKVVTGNGPSSNELPPVTGGYPGGRQKPVNYGKLVFHSMCDGGLLSDRTDAQKKHQPAQLNDSIFMWNDLAERGRDSSVSFPTNQGTTYPTLVSLKPDATFPLARERRFIRFSGEGSPGAALSSSAKNQAREFPFGSATTGNSRGLTFAVVFFQEVKGRQQTVFNLSSQHGSASLRLGDKGEVRFNGRVNGIPDNQQHLALVIPKDKFNPIEPLLVIGVWRAEPSEVLLRLRSASGYSFQTEPVSAPVPKDALGSLLIGREGMPGPTSTNKSTDPKSLRAFSGGIAELLIYATPLNEGEIKSLEAQLASYYFPPSKS